MEVVIFECLPPESARGDEANAPNPPPDSITWRPLDREYAPGDPACGEWPVADNSNQRPAAVTVIGQLLDPSQPNPWIVGRNDAGDLVIVTNAAGELRPEFAK